MIIKHSLKRNKDQVSFHLHLFICGDTYGVWFDYTLGKIFVSNDYVKGSPYVFSCTLADHIPNTMLLNSAKKYNCWKNFIDNYKMGNVRFENVKIKNVCQEVLKNMLVHS